MFQGARWDDEIDRYYTPDDKFNLGMYLMGPQRQPQEDAVIRNPQPGDYGEPVIRQRTAADLPYEVIREPVKEDLGAYTRADPVYKWMKGITTGVERDLTPPNNWESEVRRPTLWEVEDIINNFSTGGLVNWAGKAHPNMFVYRGMRSPDEEIAWLDNVIQNAKRIKNPYEQSATLISPKYLGTAAPEGVIYHGDTSQMPAIGIADIYTGYSRGPRMFMDKPREARTHLYNKANLIDREGQADILADLAPHQPGISWLRDMVNYRDRAKAALRSDVVEDYGPIPKSPQRLGDYVREKFGNLFKRVEGEGELSGFVPRDRAMSGLSQFEGPFNPIMDIERSHRLRKAGDRVGNRYDLWNTYGPPDTAAEKYRSTSRPEFFVDPNRVTADDFFRLQGERFATTTDKPSGKYNEVVHRIDKDIRDRLAGVRVNPDNPNQALLDFAEKYELPVYSFPYYAEKKAPAGIEDIIGRLQYKKDDLGMRSVIDPETMTTKDWDKGEKYDAAIKKMKALRDVGKPRQPWKSLMTTDDPLGGEWVKKAPDEMTLDLRNIPSAFVRNLSDDDLRKFILARDKEGYIASGVQDLNKLMQYWRKGNMGNHPLDEERSEVFISLFGPPKRSGPPALTSSEIPGGYKYHYTGSDFSWE